MPVYRVQYFWGKQIQVLIGVYELVKWKKNCFVVDTTLRIWRLFNSLNMAYVRKKFMSCDIRWTGAKNKTPKNAVQFLIDSGFYAMFYE